MAFNPFEAGNEEIAEYVEILTPDDPKKNSVAAPREKVTLGNHVVPPSLIRNGDNGNNMPALTSDNLADVMNERRSGRMSTFSADRAATVLEAMEDGATMVEAAKTIGVTRKTLWAWMNLSAAFRDQVSLARKLQGHAMADDAVEILDNVIIDPDQPKVAMAELRKAEQMARIRMDQAKAHTPEYYGDKRTNLNLNVNTTVSPVDLSAYSM